MKLHFKTNLMILIYCHTFFKKFGQTLLFFDLTQSLEVQLFMNGGSSELVGN